LTLLLIFGYPLLFAAFHVPGLFLALRFLHLPTHREEPEPVLRGTVCSALLGYLAFWTYFCSPRLGYLLSLGWLGFALWCCLWAKVDGKLLRQRLLDPDLAEPLGFTFLIGLVYFAIFHSVQFKEKFPFNWNQTQMLARYPGFIMARDEEIPYGLAFLMHAGRDPRSLSYHRESGKPFFYGDWRASDRPPLQAGLILLPFPAFTWLVHPIEQPIGETVVLRAEQIFYQIAGTIYQCTWIPCAWLLLASHGLRGRNAMLPLLMIVCTGFFYLNSVYLWPKSLSAGLGGYACYAVLKWLNRRTVTNGIEATDVDLYLGSVAGGLALLAHGGAFFAMLALAGWCLMRLLLLRRLVASLKPLLASALLLAALLIPWVLYQKFYDPPGDRLIKWHLGGQQEVDESRSAWEVVTQAYQSRTVQEHLQLKLRNFVRILGIPPSHSDLAHSQDFLTWWRGCEYHYVTFALGLLWLGLPILVLRPWPAWDLAGLAGLGLLVWWLMMFEIASLHLSSYPTILLLAVTLAIQVTRLPEVWRWTVLGLQLLLFSVVWIFAQPLAIDWEQGYVDGWQVAVAGLGLAATVWHSRRFLCDAEPASDSTQRGHSPE
jgi:hypothetical protein